MKTLVSLMALLCAVNFSYAQTQIITNGNKTVNPSDPYSADIVIGSDFNSGARHDGSIMLWCTNSASRIWNTGDVFYLSQWSTTNPNVALNAAVGGQSYVQGNLAIGSTDTHGYKLAVNGNIHTKEVNVDNINWPDYVFKPTYHLPALSEVKTYIDQNQHLPEMPSEQDVAKDGINLGEMVKLQTKKIEELTLYLIEKDKETQYLKKRAAAQEQQLDQFKQQLTALIKEMHRN